MWARGGSREGKEHYVRKSPHPNVVRESVVIEDAEKRVKDPVPDLKDAQTSSRGKNRCEHVRCL